MQRVPGAVSSEVNRPGREADHFPPFSAKIKMSELYLYYAKFVYGFVLNLYSTRVTLPHANMETSWTL
jgi:hypothetical protein